MMLRRLLVALSLLWAAQPLLAQSLLINEVMSSNAAALADEDGDFPDWIELYNDGSTPLDLTGYGLSDDPALPFKWSFSGGTLAANAFGLIYASGKDRPGTHTNFKINSAGETVYLTRPDGVTADSVILGAIPADISYGRQADGMPNWFFFHESTPGGSNDTQGIEIVQAVTSFSLPGGVYSGPVSVTLASESEIATMLYTLDGSEPSAASPVYTAPLAFSQTTVLRTRVMMSGVLSGVVSTQTYVINDHANLAVVSIATPPENLWDPATGIYTNWELEEEIPIHLEFFEPYGAGFAMAGGMRIHGDWTRQFPQKSLAIFARDVYGPSSIKYRLFGDLPLDQFESIILRNSGGDFDSSHFRDALQQRLIASLDLDTQAYRPVVVYLNGAYWGLLNMREKLNEHYIASHHGVKPDELDMLENHNEVVHGDTLHYGTLLAFVAASDMTQAASYAHVRTLMDMDNYLDYMVSQIYFANVDWPGWNLKYWRPRTPEGKWRWMVFDLDDGFGLGSPVDFGYANMFAFVTAVDGPEWPNPPWSTFLLRRLLENPTFKRDFLNRFADYLNTIWQPDVVQTHIDAMVAELAAEIQSHLDRWTLTLQDWQWEVDALGTFGQNRAAAVFGNIVAELGVAGTRTLTLDNADPGRGHIGVNQTIAVSDSSWQGTYFQDVPVNLLAVPAPGYAFDGWTGAVQSSTAGISVPMTGDAVLTAHFSADQTLTETVVINEINYRAPGHFDTSDWLELYNDSAAPRDLSGWTIQDSDTSHNFVFPNGTSLAANGFVVVCRDTAAFSRFFPQVVPLAVELGFGLNDSLESVLLYDAVGNLIDSVTYASTPPWPQEPDGGGATLALLAPELDNALAQSWSASQGYGSPGGANQIATSVPAPAGNQLPERFHLAQNYPNPFNPTTTIGLSLPSAGRVSVKVYDIMGREVATIREGLMTAGRHTVVWHATALPSGIYLYRIRAEGFVQTRRMLLLK